MELPPHYDETDERFGKPHDPLSDEFQRIRYAVAAKGGDGDPPFARDVSLAKAQTRAALRRLPSYLRTDGD